MIKLSWTREIVPWWPLEYHITQLIERITETMILAFSCIKRYTAVYQVQKISRSKADMIGFATSLFNSRCAPTSKGFDMIQLHFHSK